MFQNDRFASLTLGTEYTLQDAQCNLNTGDVPMEQRKNISMSTLAIIAGKVIAQLHTQSEHFYDTTLSLDQELNYLAAQLPLGYWKIVPFVPKNVEEALDLTTTMGGQSIYFQTKTTLHMPYMLKAISNPAYEFSRNTCFDADGNYGRHGRHNKRLERPCSWSSSYHFTTKFWKTPKKT
jgi:hypothetical protein